MDKYLTYTKGLVDHIYWFTEEFDIEPKKEHYGLSINHTDIKERRTDFLKELINTIVSWVYSKAKLKDLYQKRYEETNDLGNAASFITHLASSRFRPGHPQGQFGELLLFNLIQEYYKAVPLLRKQNITTSRGHERFGADAIHYTYKEGKNIIILGESKCYKSKYKFNDAFKTSLNSILTSFKNIDDELDLYLYEDFIEPELQSVAESYKNGTLKNVHFELVCIIVYNETDNLNGDDETSIKENIKNIIKNRYAKFDKQVFKNFDSKILKRINYIVFPIWKLDELLSDFQNKVAANETN